MLSQYLTKKGWDVIKQHPVLGADIISEYRVLHRLIPSILYHHERYDGTGYPAGLNRESIPLGARIIAVADSFDAMTTDRSYRKRNKL
ncbi:MAG: HD-GYP domain-containing protein [Bacillota bacterium]|nr:HD domain-containing phosphohydrolase [Desulfurispora thermophila]